VAEVFSACTGGAAITAWALHLGCGTAVLGLLGALPFVAHVLQLPAAALTRRVGPRRVALWAVAVSRQAFLPLAVLPAVPPGAAGPRALLVLAAAALHGAGIVCNNGWVAWMGELVPAHLRGRYFGRRTAVCTAAGALASLAAGALLDLGRGGPRLDAVLRGLAVAASAAGVLSTILMARQHGGARRPTLAGAGRAGLGAVLRGRAARRLAGYLALSGAASGLAVPYLGLFMLRDRGLGFAFVAAHGTLAALARTAASAAWGRRVDRPGGAARVLGWTAMAAVASPLLWLGAALGGPWLLLVEAALGGAAGAGASVAGTALPLALAPPGERAAYHAVFAVSGGLAFGAGAAAAAWLAHAGPGGAFAGPLTVPFASCAALRILSARRAFSLAREAPVAPAATGRGPRRACA
jgi:MFS family permease